MAEPAPTTAPAPPPNPIKRPTCLFLKTGLCLTSDPRTTLAIFRQASFESLGRTTLLQGRILDDKVILKCKTKDCSFLVAAVKMHPGLAPITYCVCDSITEHTAFCKNNHLDLTMDDDEEPLGQTGETDDEELDMEDKASQAEYAKEMGFASHEELVTAENWLKGLLSSCIDTFNVELVEEFSYALTEYSDELSSVYEYMCNCLKSKGEISPALPSTT